MPFEIFGEGIFREKNFINETPTGPSLGQSVSFDASCVQFGSVIWSVGPVTLFTACSIAHASQLKIHLEVTFRSASILYQHKICRLLTKFGACKLIRLQFIASTNVTIQQIAIIANHGNVKYNAQT
jgi:hypothetical protein